MNIEHWSTRAAPDTAFASRWTEAVSRAPLANFSLLLDHVRFEAAAGRHSTLALANHHDRRMALVLRECAGEFHCGWPWRWQAVFCDDASPGAGAPARSESLLLFRAAQAAAGGVRLRVQLPGDPGSRAPGFRTGSTIVQRLDVGDEELFESMDPNKRRLTRRAIGEGFVVRVGGQPEDHEAYAALDRAAARPRGDEAPAPGGDADPSEPWREWELPWMRLFVAEREGCVEACAGDGVAPGAMADGRYAVSSAEARKLGVMALLCHEELRLLRDAGLRWFNHGGDTAFKREVAGRLGNSVDMFAWLGGGRRHALANQAEALLQRSRPTVAGWVRVANQSLDTPDRRDG